MTSRINLILGDALIELRNLPDESVHCCVTSPPYFGLRNYGVAPSVWDGNPECEHVWGEWVEKHDEREEKVHGKTRTTDRYYGGPSRRFDGNHQKHTAGAFCGKCGAWCGCFGLEPTPELYVEHAVTIFREVRRVLRSDGTFYINIGDSFASTRGTGQSRHWDGRQKNTETQSHRCAPTGDIKPKDLIGIPWMLAFALRADGWFLRSDNIWAKGVSGQKEIERQVYQAAVKSGVGEDTAQKIVDSLDLYVGNCMPESVQDRPTRAHEYVFLFSKSQKYFYDHHAIREELKTTSNLRTKANEKHALAVGGIGKGEREWNSFASGRNRRSVWIIPTKPFKEAHFAVFPPDLVAPIIQLGTSEKGCCPKCSSPYKREVAKDTQITSWEATCNCDAGAPVPCTVLDPFSGAGTSGLVSLQLGRKYIGIELNEDYAIMSANRIRRELGKASK